MGIPKGARVEAGKNVLIYKEIYNALAFTLPPVGNFLFEFSLFTERKQIDWLELVKNLRQNKVLTGALKVLVLKKLNINVK